MISTGKKEVVLTPVETGLCHVLLLSKKNCCFDHDCRECCLCCYLPFDIPDKDILDFLETRWEELSGRLENIRNRLSVRPDRREWFLQHSSRINRKLKRAGIPEKFHIVSRGAYGQSVYGLQVDKKNIETG